MSTILYSRERRSLCRSTLSEKERPDKEKKERKRERRERERREDHQRQVSLEAGCQQRWRQRRRRRRRRRWSREIFFNKSLECKTTNFFEGLVSSFILSFHRITTILVVVVVAVVVIAVVVIHVVDIVAVVVALEDCICKQTLCLTKVISWTLKMIEDKLNKLQRLGSGFYVSWLVLQQQRTKQISLKSHQLVFTYVPLGVWFFHNRKLWVREDSSYSIICLV